MFTTQDLANKAAVKLAMECLWSASLELSGNRHSTNHLTNRCIYATLALVDVLAAVGIASYPFACGLEVTRHFPDPDLSISSRVTIGILPHSDNPLELNAHVVAQVGGMLADPTLAQMRKFWNDVPDYWVVPIRPNFQAGKAAQSKRIEERTISHVGTAGGTMVRYFDLSKKYARQARVWKKMPDARPDMRRSLVDRTVELMCTVIDRGNISSS